MTATKASLLRAECGCGMFRCCPKFEPEPRAKYVPGKHYRRSKPELHAVYLGKRDHFAIHHARVKTAAAASLKATAGAPTSPTPL